MSIPSRLPQMQAVDTLDEIDRALKEAHLLADVIQRGPGGREAALVITKLEEAQMWIGACMVKVDEAHKKARQANATQE